MVMILPVFGVHRNCAPDKPRPQLLLYRSAKAAEACRTTGRRFWQSAMPSPLYATPPCPAVAMTARNVGRPRGVCLNGTRCGLTHGALADTEKFNGKTTE
jgi:hypothetical protein